MEYLTTGNIALALMAIYAVAKLVVPWTASDKDDKALKAVDDAIAWIQIHAPDIWAIIEAASQKGQITGGSAKLYAFLEALNAAHLSDTGGNLPAEAVEAAKRKAAGLSAADSISKAPSAAKPVDPPSAPASR